MRILAVFAAVAVLALGACAETQEQRVRDAQDLVDQSKATLERFKTNPSFSDFQGEIRKAHGLVIFPTVVKGGFLFGAEGGSGVLIARGEDGTWSPPAFYTTGGGSFGLQIGIQGGEMVLVLRNPKAVRAVLDHQGKLGAEIGLAVGPLGAGAEAATTTNVGADVVAFSSALGLFGGVALEGAVLARRSDLNHAYYGEAVTPQEIVLLRKVANPKAEALRNAAQMN
jgi:lipid-binding SYLF domain-containing protein